MYQHIKVPEGGKKITVNADFSLNVPDQPIIPYIEGDGTGMDITPVMLKVVDAAVEKSYGGKRRIHWMEVYAGEKSTRIYGPDVWLPEETLEVVREYVVSIKGPLTTPVGGGIRSLNVALRQELDLYVCLRPIQYFKGVPSPVKAPGEDQHGDLPRELGGHLRRHRVRSRERQGQEAHQVPDRRDGGHQDPLPEHLGHRHQAGVSRRHRTPGAQGHPVRDRQRQAQRDPRAQGQHHEVHRGRLPRLGLWRWRSGSSAPRSIDGGPWCKFKNPKTGKDIIVKDVIADAFLQQILLRPAEYSVIATLNLNGDYVSDALAAQVGGIGIAPGANLSDSVAMFEATHGTAPKYAGKDYVNPGSEILSAEMMLRHMGWTEAADLIISSMEKSILSKKVTYDFARLMDGATQVSCSGFGQVMIDHM